MKKSRIWKGCTGDDIYVKKYCIVMALDHKRKAFTDGNTTVMYISISHIYDNFILKTQRNLWLFEFLFFFKLQIYHLQLIRECHCTGNTDVAN